MVVTGVGIRRRPLAIYDDPMVNVLISVDDAPGRPRVQLISWDEQIADRASDLAAPLDEVSASCGPPRSIRLHFGYIALRFSRELPL